MTKNVDEGVKNGLNNHQIAHLYGGLDVYKPIEAYTEEWVHNTDSEGNFVSAYPKPGTKVRSDLPPLAEQWRADAAKRFKK